ncbi:MAG: PH domain-containing protein [Lachnospiraceae bacterium]|nr:PH domain-containing protein [Lachnospiraceae bacterium]
MPHEKKPILWRDRKRTFLGLPWSFTIYSVDAERIYIEKGFFNKTEDEVRLYRIMDISLKMTFIQRLFGIGTIHVDSADKTLRDFDILKVKKPKEVKELLSQLVEQERENKHVTGREYLHGGDDEVTAEEMFSGDYEADDDGDGDM